MQHRLAILLALLIALLALPSAASAQRAGGTGPWSGGSASAGGGTTGTGTSADAGRSGSAVPSDDGDWGDDDWGDGTSDGTGSDGGATPGGAGTAPGTGAGTVPGTGTTTPAPAVDPSVLVPVPSARRTVKGKVARIRTDGLAAIPRSAPKAVKRVIAAANLIVGKPYKWGGGHARLIDSGYDCSGAVSYALIRAGLQQGSMVSGSFARWAAAGAGRWISIHANAGHVYMEVAGLRLDTSAVGDQAGRSGVRWRPVIGRRTGFHTRHLVGL